MIKERVGSVWMSKDSMEFNIFKEDDGMWVSYTPKYEVFNRDGEADTNEDSFLPIEFLIEGSIDIASCSRR